ncbi:ATP-grasp domain-containing protein [Streptomyces sp. NPDC005808]|uniref:ATP-grasp domain-containing protein n=1 Tax=Streptomyces sp. NPDC005808 TaxID=3364734 RepID=UPI0036756929
MPQPVFNPAVTGLITSAARRPGRAAVVAPYSTGGYYLAEFVRRGWECVAVLPADDALPPLYRGALDPLGYRSVVVHRGDLAATAGQLRTLRVDAVVAGTEIGVPLAEQLAHRLGLPGNAPGTSHLRRDKGAMAAALAEAGIEGPRTLSTDRLADALDFAAALDGTGVVLKPADSGGSDGVIFCSTPGELRTAWDTLHGQPNALGGDNQFLIVQERLGGAQYVVNSVTVGGRHQITDIWADRKVGDTHVYDRADLLPARSALTRRLLAGYTRKVLDALGVVAGPAHTEVRNVLGRGPVLIESGARPEGAYDVAVMRQATGSDHIQDAVHAVVTGTLPPYPSPSPLPVQVAKVSLIAPHTSVLDEEHLQSLLTLPTVRGYSGTLEPGMTVHRTVDLLTTPARLMLVDADAHAVDRDYEAIRELEAAGLYGGGAR